MRSTQVLDVRPASSELTVTLNRIYRFEGFLRTLGVADAGYEVVTATSVVTKDKLDLLFETEEAFNWFVQHGGSGFSFRLSAESVICNVFDDVREIIELTDDCGERVAIPAEFKDSIFVALYAPYMGVTE